MYGPSCRTCIQALVLHIELMSHHVEYEHGYKETMTPKLFFRNRHCEPFWRLIQLKPHNTSHFSSISDVLLTHATDYKIAFWQGWWYRLKEDIAILKCWLLSWPYQVRVFVPSLARLIIWFPLRSFVRSFILSLFRSFTLVVCYFVFVHSSVYSSYCLTKIICYFWRQITITQHGHR